MDINDIPEAQNRMELEKVPDKIELLLVEEKPINALVDAETGKTVKTGGVNMLFKTRKTDEGKELFLTQKYSASFGTLFREGMKALGYTNTISLKDRWHLYEKQMPKLNVKGTVYPRLIPIKALENSTEVKKAKK